MRQVLVAILMLGATYGCSSDGKPGEESAPTTVATPSASSSPWTGIAGVEVQPSAGCADAMASAAAETDSARAEPLIQATLSACQNVDEWLSALQISPGAMGLVHGAPIGLLDVQSACNKYRSEPVCADAIAGGVTF